jgi:hypothetical protein
LQTYCFNGILVGISLVGKYNQVASKADHMLEVDLVVVDNLVGLVVVEGNLAVVGNLVVGVILDINLMLKDKLGVDIILEAISTL